MRFALVAGYSLVRFQGHVMEFEDRAEAMSYARDNGITARTYPILKSEEDRIILDAGCTDEE